MNDCRMYRKLRAFTKKEGEEPIQFPLTNFSQKATFPYRADVDTAVGLPPPPPPPRPQDSPLVVRHALAQILVFTLREVEQVGRLIQSIDSTNCFHKLHQPISSMSLYTQGTYKGGYEEQKRQKTLTVEIKLASPGLSLELSHHMPPPRPFPRMNWLFLAMMSGVS
jgi:hypothetical protein